MRYWRTETVLAESAPGCWSAWGRKTENAESAFGLYRSLEAGIVLRWVRRKARKRATRRVVLGFS